MKLKNILTAISLSAASCTPYHNTAEPEAPVSQPASFDHEGWRKLADTLHQQLFLRIRAVESYPGMTAECAQASSECYRQAEAVRQRINQLLPNLSDICGHHDPDERHACETQQFIGAGLSVDRLEYEELYNKCLEMDTECAERTIAERIERNRRNDQRFRVEYTRESAGARSLQTEMDSIGAAIRLHSSLTAKAPDHLVQCQQEAQEKNLASQASLKAYHTEMEKEGMKFEPSRARELYLDYLKKGLMQREQVYECLRQANDAEGMNSGVRYHYDQATETLDQVYETVLNQPQLIEQCLGAKELRSCLSEQAAKLEKAKETENQPNASFFAASHMRQASECADRLKTCVTHQASENEDQ